MVQSLHLDAIPGCVVKLYQSEEKADNEHLDWKSLFIYLRAVLHRRYIKDPEFLGHY